MQEVASELLDRYGPLPDAVEALLAVARFRVLARSAGLTEVVLQGSAIRFHPVNLPESGQMRLARLYPLVGDALKQRFAGWNAYFFTGDLRLPNATWAGFARSTVAHARIARIDVTAARAMPGVLGVFTAADLALTKAPSMFPGMVQPPFLRPFLATDRVHSSERGALNSLILMSCWTLGGSMIVNLAGLQAIPKTYYEAAEIDGAGRWTRFWRITIPLLSPTIFFNLVMGVIGSFQVFTQGLIMTAGGPNNSTCFYVLNTYRNAFEFFRMGYASALAWILFAITPK